MDKDLGAVEHDACLGRGSGGLAGSGVSCQDIFPLLEVPDVGMKWPVNEVLD